MGGRLHRSVGVVALKLGVERSVRGQVEEHPVLLLFEEPQSHSSRNERDEEEVSEVVLGSLERVGVRALPRIQSPTAGGEDDGINATKSRLRLCQNLLQILRFESITGEDVRLLCGKTTNRFLEFASSPREEGGITFVLNELSSDGPTNVATSSDDKDGLVSHLIASVGCRHIKVLVYTRA